MLKRSGCVVAAVVGCLACGEAVFADETDQFTLPPRETFADLGPYFDLLHYRVLERVVDDMNARIDSAFTINNDARRQKTLDTLHAPERLADRARHYFGQGWTVARALESALKSDSADAVYPDRRSLYFTSDWIYANTHFVLDPRQVMYNFRGSTILVHRVFFGVDKVGHGHDLGHLYYKSYRRGLASGMSEEDAMARTIRVFSTGAISERGIIGAVGTGVNSNADLASNYLGMKFYINMTEPTMLKGEMHPPLLVRIGEYWALNQHVRPDAGFMEPFYSDHLNEALNPCIYGRGMRDEICSRLRERREKILALYGDDEGQPRSREYFEQLYEELSTYYGEDYGHGGIDPVATIANCCFVDENAMDEAASHEDKGLDPATAP